MLTIPIDSTDAREQREAEQHQADLLVDEQTRHDTECRGGWRGEDDHGRPRPCTQCRPWLAHVACRTCSAPWQACQNLQSIRRGPCCTDCDHAPTTNQRNR